MPRCVDEFHPKMVQWKRKKRSIAEKVKRKYRFRLKRSASSAVSYSLSANFITSLSGETDFEKILSPDSDMGSTSARLILVKKSCNPPEYPQQGKAYLSDHVEQLIKLPMSVDKFPHGTHIVFSCNEQQGDEEEPNSWRILCNNGEWTGKLSPCHQQTENETAPAFDSSCDYNVPEEGKHKMAIFWQDKQISGKVSIPSGEELLYRCVDIGKYQNRQKAEGKVSIGRV